MLKHKEEFESLYKKNKQNGRYIIDISLDDYNDFFHEWDESAYTKREINPEIESFLDTCSEDIPLNKKLEIIFTIKEEVREPKKEKTVIESYHNNYKLLRNLEKNKIKKMIKEVVTAFAIAAVILLAYFSTAVWNDLSIAIQSIREAVLIGAWVFVWEGVHLMSYEYRGERERFRELGRFLDANLKFEYQ